MSPRCTHHPQGTYGCANDGDHVLVRGDGAPEPTLGFWCGVHAGPAAAAQGADWDAILVDPEPEAEDPSRALPRAFYVRDE